MTTGPLKYGGRRGEEKERKREEKEQYTGKKQENIWKKSEMEIRWKLSDEEEEVKRGK